MAFYADLKITPANKSQNLDSSISGITKEKLNEKRLKINQKGVLKWRKA